MKCCRTKQDSQTSKQTISRFNGQSYTRKIYSLSSCQPQRRDGLAAALPRYIDFYDSTSLRLGLWTRSFGCEELVLSVSSPSSFLTSITQTSCPILPSGTLPGVHHLSLLVVLSPLSRATLTWQQSKLFSCPCRVPLSY